MSVAIGLSDEIGEFLKELRVNSGLSQEALAARMGVTYNAISMIERGHNYPRWGTVIAWGEGCDVDLWLTAEIKDE